MPDSHAVGERVREVRKRCGLTQRQLAAASGLSASLVRRLEQGDYGGIRLETVHKLAIVLGVPTSALIAGPDAEEAPAPSVAQWEPVQRALEGAPGGEPAEEPTLAGVTAASGGLVTLFRASRFTEMGRVLPALLRDADALVGGTVNGEQVAARRLRAQVRVVTASLMSQTWQFAAAERAFGMAMEDAEAAGPLARIAAVEEKCFGLIRQGRLAEGHELAVRWADEAEPRMSTATREELAAWGRLLTWASTAAARDNLPGEAAEMVRLARMAAAGTGGDFTLGYAPWHQFGPSTVLVTQAENLMIRDRPGPVLAIGAQIERRGLAHIYTRHRLDVANAHAALRQHAEAVAVLQEMRRIAPQWLVQQRYARDILGKVMSFFHPGFPQGMCRFDRPGPGSFCWSSGVRGAGLGYGGAGGSGVAAR